MPLVGSRACAPKKAALLYGKTLRSAVANAENNHELDADELVVRSAVATPGPALKPNVRS